MTKKVLSIGQCALDHSNISQLLNDNFDVEIVVASTHDEALQNARHSKFDLILINRIYDKTGTLGIDTIEALQAEATAGDCPIMLISNFEDAQEKAIASGAVRGFGKNSLSDPQTISELQTHLA